MDEHASEQMKRMRDANFEVAEGEPDPRGWTVVVGTDKAFGVVDELIIDTAAMKVRFLEVRPQRTDGREHIYIPIEQVDFDASTECVVIDGTLAPVDDVMGTAGTRGSISGHGEAITGSERSVAASGGTQDVQRLTRAEEEVRVGKRAVAAGEIRASKHIRTEHVQENVTLRRDDVTIERRPVTEGAYSTPDLRASEAEIRVPIVEEQVVIEKRPVVKEELVISKTQVQETQPVDVEVRKEEFDIEDDRTGRSRGGK